MRSNSNRRQFIKRAMGLMAGAAAVPLVSSCASSGGSTANTMKPVAAAAPATKEHIVEIKSFEFSPKNLNVKAGDRVTWINRDSAPHTATASDRSWDTGTINQNERKSVVITAGIVTDYFCLFHPMMRGKIVVT